ncbi:MAG: phosphoglucosamine mutase [Planctomycetota bacterium]
MKEPIISVSGLRGVVGQSLSPVIAAAYATAFATAMPPGDLVITRDGRPSGKLLADAIRATFAALGRNVIDAGIAATPTTGTLIRKYEAAGGIQISASHNPAEYNGIKLFGPEGRVLSASVGEQILHHYRAGESEDAWVSHQQLGVICEDDAPHQRHLELVMATIDIERVRARKFRVLLDSNHGAGSLLGRRLLTELGCDVVALGGATDGLFAHPPEPTADNLQGVCQQVTEQQCVVGFCQDPDADRLALIDANGRYVGEEYTVALCCDRVLCHQRGPVVTNCSTSRMTQDLAERYGVPFFRSKVGEANVCDRMIAEKAVFGGEGNGGPIDPRVGYVRDSFVGMALVLSLMADRDQSLGALVDALPRYAIHKTKVTLGPEAVPTAIEKLKAHFDAAEPNELDGLRLDWSDKWFLFRASNTEPIVRFVAEAPTDEEASRLCTEAIEVIQT